MYLFYNGMCIFLYFRFFKFFLSVITVLGSKTDLILHFYKMPNSFKNRRKYKIKIKEKENYYAKMILVISVTLKKIP